METYDRFDAALYDYAFKGLEGDVDFYVAESQQAGSPVLELGCGTGRITLPIAEAGIEVSGLDLSIPMLEVARKKYSSLPPEIQARITLVEGDMRDFSLDMQFNLIMIPFRAFSHLISVDDQKRALRCIREHLSDDGRLIFNIFDPRLDFIGGHQGPLGAAMKMDGEFIHPENGRRIVVWDTRQYDLGSQTLEQYFIFEELDGDGKVVSKRYNPLKLRYFFRYEVQHLLELCGYEVETLYGDFDHSAFKYGGEQIWVARKH